MLSVTSTLLTQKTKVAFSLFELVVIKHVVGKLFNSKSTSEYVYCISFCMQYFMSSYISVLSWHFTLNVRVGLILGEGKKFVPLNPT
jgi:ABC-type sugar transport system permease subunit